MSIYDDERVIALLHDAVPAVPDAPDRLDAVRHRAGRQRVRAWSQGLGVVVVVLLVVGVAASLGSGKPNGVHPVHDPLRVMTDALLDQSTAQFHVTAHATSASGAVPDVPDADLTGAVTRDGELRLDGSLGALAAVILNDPASDVHVRVVDGKVYGSGSMLHLDPAKEWVRGTETPVYGIADARRYLRMAAAFVDEPTYLRTTTIDGVEVAVYRVDIPTKFTHGQRVDMTFAMDAHDLPRRIDVDLPYTALMDAPMVAGRDVRLAIGIDLYGYGDAVDIAPPTGVRFLNDTEYTERADKADEEQSRQLDQCMKTAHTDAAKQQCFAKYPGPRYGMDSSTSVAVTPMVPAVGSPGYVDGSGSTETTPTP